MRIVCLCPNPAVDVSSEATTVQAMRKVRTRNERMEPGGGGVNVARVLTRFGVPNELVYLSGGATGKVLDAELDRVGIQSHRIPVEERTRIAFNVVQSDGGQEYRFVPEGPCINSEELKAFMSLVEAMPLQPTDIVVASGSLPRNVPDDTYARIARLVASHHSRFILDTSGSALAVTLDQAQVFLIKPSLGELEKLAGYKLDEAGARDVSLELVKEGCAQHVAVSMGSHGAFLANANGVLRLPAHLVKTRSAVGAGDSFLAGMVSHLAKGNSIEEAFRFGVAAGAAAVLTAGTELCHREDVLSLYESMSSAGQALNAYVRA